MGCTAFKKKIKNSQKAESLPPRSITQLNKLAKKRKSIRKISGFVETESDFWGTVPFYVLKNRLRLLSFEVNDPLLFQEISESIFEIFSYFINQPIESPFKFNISDKKYSWITLHAQGIKVIRSIGLNLQESSLELMEGVTKDHLKQKHQETKFVISSLSDNSLTQTI
jgi:hypothetical protein